MQNAMVSLREYTRRCETVDNIHEVIGYPCARDRDYYNNNNIIYIALYTKVLKRFTMEEENKIIKLTLPKK